MSKFHQICLVGVAQRVKHLPAMWETWLRSLGQEDPLEKEMATHSSTLAWTERPGRLQSVGLQSWAQLSDFTPCLTLCLVGAISN